MLERLYNKILDEKIINIIKNNEKYKKMFVLSIFLLNLSLYSIPLLFFHLEIIKVSQEFINIYTRIIYNLDLLKIDKKIIENVIIVKDFRFYIDQQCLGLKSMLSMFAIIMATPIKSLKKRIKYLLIALPIVFILNIIRIYSTIYLFYFFNVDPYIVHDVLWEFFNTFFIFSIWYIFYKNVKSDIILAS